MADSKRCVLLFRDDFQRMKDWVLQYPDRETGGQFFGLWTHNKHPYVNVVIGPGQGCRHETHSFHQDIAYLKDVGRHLNKEFMMCHIGEWHSHHRLRLRQPSSGDLNSVWNHFPAGVEFFLLVIATIEAGDVKLWPWLFSASSHSHDQIELKIIDKENVFLKDDVVKRTIESGAELRPRVAELPSAEPWYHSSWGQIFVQHLNSELESQITNGSGVDKTLKGQSKLRFTFQHHNRIWVLEFPCDFPSHDVHITIKDQKTQRVVYGNQTRRSQDVGRVEALLETIRHACPVCR